MPNYVRNIVTFLGKKDSLEKLIALLKQDGHDELDFNVIIPMPKELAKMDGDQDPVHVAMGEYITDGTFACVRLKSMMYGTVKAEMEAKLGRSYKTDRELVKAFMIHTLKRPYLDDMFFAQCVQVYKNFKKYGYTDWFDWSNDNWGTKWNACDADSLLVLLPKKEANGEFSMTYRFDTAWTIPKEIYVALSKMFPDITIHVDYADEDYGTNCGTVCYKEGTEFRIYDSVEGTKKAVCFAIRIWNHEEMIPFVKKNRAGEWHFDVDAYDAYLDSKKK